MILNVGYFLPRCAVLGLMMALDQLTLRATQRAEYLADSSRPAPAPPRPPWA